MKYTDEDKICPHCGGKLAWHVAGEKAIKWCDDCGSNDSEKKPNVELTFN